MKGSNNSEIKLQLKDEKFINKNFYNFAKIIQNAIYFGMSTDLQKEFPNLSLWIKLKMIIDHSFFVQILIAISISFIFLIILSLKFTFWNSELVKEKIEDFKIDKDRKSTQNTNINTIAENHQSNVIFLEENKLEEFIKKLKNEKKSLI